MRKSETYIVKPLKPNLEEVSNLNDPSIQYKERNFEFAGSLISAVIGFVWLLVSGFRGCLATFSDSYKQSEFAARGWLLAFILAFIFYRIHDGGVENDEKENELKNQKYRQKCAEENSKKEAAKTTNYLIELISKSQELATNVIPYYVNSIDQSLITCEYHLKNRAINNYFDSIEETVIHIACFKDIIDDIKSNINKYSQALAGRDHNFPSTFPVSIHNFNIQNQLFKLHKLNYQADRTPEFAVVYNQRKLIEVNIAGFENIREGLKLAEMKISDSISELSYSIRDTHERIIENQKRQIDSFEIHSKLQESHQAEINHQLNSIDNKLYYIEYKKRPISSFRRPFLGD